MADVIDLGRARLRRHLAEALELKRLPLASEAVFGTVELVDGHVRVNIQGDYTPAAAEALARELYRIAGVARGGARG